MALGRHLLLLDFYFVLFFGISMSNDFGRNLLYFLFDMIRSFEQLKSCDFVFLAFENIKGLFLCDINKNTFLYLTQLMVK